MYNNSIRKLKNFVGNVLPYGVSKRYFYPPVSIPSSVYPKLYNQFGEEMLYVYMKDNISAHLPYSLVSGRIPRRVVWDRYNTGLDLQMYGHISILDRLPLRENTKQFGIAVESEIIRPYEYEQLLKNESSVNSLVALFTYSERLLDKYSNAKFAICQGVWYGTELYGGTMSPDNWEHKTKLLSIVASAKHKVPLHCFRAEVARGLKRSGLADAMGTSVGEYFDKISDAFDDYMYNVSIENDQKKYYFTEKILDCFASMTVPVYYGATEIGKFFNEDGIIKIKDPTMECVLKAIKQCSKQDYHDRLDAIKDNYNRVQQYLSSDDYIFNNYFELFNTK